MIGWFKKLSRPIQIILMIVVLFVGSAVVAGIYEGITMSDEDRTELADKQEKEKAQMDEDKKRKEKEASDKKKAEAKKDKEEQEAAKKKEEAPEEDEVTWDDIKNQDKIVGKSNKDFKELTKSKPSDVRNDKTGNWRKSTFAENANIEEYLLSYESLYMKENEVHFIINFNYNTTTVVNKLGGLLYVDIKEHEKREEHSADTIGSGMLLKSYVIYPDGDIEDIEE